MSLVTPQLGEAAVVVPRQPKEMVSITKDEATGKELVRINSSSIQTSQECPRKAQYTLYEGWRPESEGAPLVAGKSLHKFLEVTYTGRPEERILPKYEYLEMMAYGHKPPPTNNDLIYRAFEALIKEAQPLAPLPESDKRSIHNLVWIGYEYLKAFQDDPYIAYCDEHGPFLERTFTYRLHEDSDLIIDLFGTIDFVFQHIKTGELLPGDHKTASFLGFGDSSFFDREKPNHQYTAYMLGARKVFGLDVENFCVNVLEIKAKPKTPKAKGVSFPRQITRRTEEDFEEFKDVVLEVVRNYLRWIATDTWPLGPVNACTQYGACSFKPVCSSPKSTRDNILQSKFVRSLK